jgi:drug/metabolite transporter (DMT)-like permease
MTRRTGSGDASSSRSSSAAGRALILGAATLWGVSATIARLAFRDHGVPPLTMVEMRLVIASAILLPWLAWRGRTALRIDSKDAGYFFLLGVLGVAAVQGTYFWSISRLGVGPAILLQYLAPALIVLFEAARGRPTGPRTIGAVAGAIAGTALLVGGLDRTTFHPRPLDWTIGSLSAVSFAFYIGYSKRGLGKYSPTTVLFYSFLIAATCWAIVTPPWRIVQAGYGPSVWGLFLVIGIGSTLIPFVLFTSGLRRLRPVETAVLSTFEPVVAIGTAALVLGEGLRPIQWLGAVFVIGATLLASTPAPREVAVAAERL